MIIQRAFYFCLHFLFDIKKNIFSHVFFFVETENYHYDNATLKEKLILIKKNINEIKLIKFIRILIVIKSLSVMFQ